MNECFCSDDLYLLKKIEHQRASREYSLPGIPRMPTVCFQNTNPTQLLLQFFITPRSLCRSLRLLHRVRSWAHVRFQISRVGAQLVTFTALAASCDALGLTAATKPASEAIAYNVIASNHELVISANAYITS
jgi:hypothetical protein